MPINIRKVFVVVFTIGVAIWWLLIISTVFMPADNPIAPVLTYFLGLPADYVAMPKPIVSEINTLEDFIYSQTLYNIFAISTLVVVTGVFTLARGRNILEKIVLFQAYALPRERDYWGKVSDADTYQPVQFAVVRILKIVNDQEIFISQTVTDLDGRYRLYVADPESMYVLEVLQSGYQTYKQTLKAVFAEGQNIITANIILHKEGGVEVSNPVRRVFLKHKSQILTIITAHVLLVSIFVTSTAIYSLVVYFNLAALGNFIFYGWAAPWNIFVLLERRKFNPGKILNASTGTELSGVTVQLTDSQGTRITLISDLNGIIKTDMQPGLYQAKVFKPGFALKQKVTGQTQVEITNQGFLKSNISLTPFSHEVSAAEVQRLLQNPFGG